MHAVSFAVLYAIFCYDVCFLLTRKYLFVSMTACIVSYNNANLCSIGMITSIVADNCSYCYREGNSKSVIR